MLNITQNVKSFQIHVGLYNGGVDIRFYSHYSSVQARREKVYVGAGRKLPPGPCPLAAAWGPTAPGNTLGQTAAYAAIPRIRG